MARCDAALKQGTRTSRTELITDLNEDLGREYQAIISRVDDPQLP